MAGPQHDQPDAVLVILRPTGSESEIGVQAFAASHGLSRREQEVLHLLGRGLTTAAMAATSARIARSFFMTDLLDRCAERLLVQTPPNVPRQIDTANRATIAGIADGCVGPARNW